VAVTSDGHSLRINLEPLVEPSTRARRRFARPAKDAEVVGVAKITGSEVLIAATAQGRGLLAKAEEVNYLSGPGKGVILITPGAAKRSAGTSPGAARSKVWIRIHGIFAREHVLSHQDRLNIAVFIDFDNIEIGVKSTLNEHFDVGIVLDGIKERGEVVTKIAYADWTRAGEYSRHLTQHAIRLVQRNLTPGGDKHGADINLALDALEMAFTHQHINAYVIVGGDSDFLSLVEKLKQYDKKVLCVR